jgi:hypothetical protein
MQILLAGECQVAPGTLIPVTNFNGLAITARMITNQVHTTLLSRGKTFMKPAAAQEVTP